MRESTAGTVGEATPSPGKSACRCTQVLEALADLPPQLPRVGHVRSAPRDTSSHADRVAIRLLRFSCLQRAGADPALREANDRAFSAPIALIAAAQSNGDTVADDPDRVALAVLATLQGLAWLVSSPSLATARSKPLSPTRSRHRSTGSSNDRPSPPTRDPASLPRPASRAIAQQQGMPPGAATARLICRRGRRHRNPTIVGWTLPRHCPTLLLRNRAEEPPSTCAHPRADPGIAGRRV
jgi:hypothetical protein